MRLKLIIAAMTLHKISGSNGYKPRLKTRLIFLAKKTTTFSSALEFFRFEVNFKQNPEKLDCKEIVDSPTANKFFSNFKPFCFKSQGLGYNEAHHLC